MRAAPPRIRWLEPAVHSLIGTRTHCIRERKARRRATSKLCFAAGPDSERIRACLLSPPLTVLRFGARTAIVGSHRRKRRRSLITRCRTNPALAAVRPAPCGCSSVGRARPRHGRGHEFETRHPLHFGCAHALRCRATRCWRPGCARPWPGHVQRDTTSDGTLARGHSRSGSPRLRSSVAEQPPCKRQGARSNRRRRHHVAFVQLAQDAGLSIRRRGFESRTRHQECLVNSAAECRPV